MILFMLCFLHFMNSRAWKCLTCGYLWRIAGNNTDQPKRGFVLCRFGGGWSRNCVYCVGIHLKTVTRFPIDQLVVILCFYWLKKQPRNQTQVRRKNRETDKHKKASQVGNTQKVKIWMSCAYIKKLFLISKVTSNANTYNTTPCPKKT